MTTIVEQRRTRTSDAADPSAQAPDSQRWQGQPLVAGLLRSSLFLLPLLTSFAVTSLSYALVTPPTTWSGRLVLWSALFVVGMLVAAVTERYARRFLPVTMLMRLTLVFPDQAPSRYRVMRSAASPSRLKEIAEGGGETAEPAVQVLALAAQLARHDKHTRGHSERVRVFADLIGEELGVTGLDRDKLRWGALLHDVGKIDVPAHILNKAGRPSQEEWALLQGHPAAGEDRAGGLVDWLGPWTGGITQHHERWDGQGYPARLAGEDISLAGRIVAVADAYETMTATRSYKKPMATRAARQELADCAGAQFDARVVRAFLAISLPRLLWRVGPLSFLLHLPFLGQLQSATLQLTAGTAQLAGTTAVAGLSAAAVITGVAPAALTVIASPAAAQETVQTQSAPARPAPHVSADLGSGDSVTGAASGTSARPATATGHALAAPQAVPAPGGPASSAASSARPPDPGRVASSVSTPGGPGPTSTSPSSPARPAASGPATAPQRPDQPSPTVKPEKAAKPAAPAKPEKAAKPAAPAKPEKAAPPKKVAEPEKAAKPLKPIKIDKPHKGDSDDKHSHHGHGDDDDDDD